MIVRLPAPPSGPDKRGEGRRDLHSVPRREGSGSPFHSEQETKEGYKYNFRRFPIAGKVEKWDWDFRDGGSGSGKKVTHIYKEAGSYTVKLTITADHKETSTAYTIVTVEEPAK
ncbi:MAG TPA: PKD domain-containing protein [bacterium]|nr:PKD domain-containing protein [bacterium]